MRKIVLIVMLGFMFSIINAQSSAQKVRIGIIASPAISWFKGADKNVNSGKVRMGVEYGILLNINLAKTQENYVLETGITGVVMGGNAVYDSLVLSANPRILAANGVDARYKMQYLNIPISLKLKTNQIGYITYYGQLGFVPGFKVGARVDSDALGYENEKLDKNNETIITAPLFAFGLNVGAGIEYALNDRTALILGVNFVNNFTNGIKLKAEDKDKQVFKYVLLRAGIMF
jgi:hypothetical protein